MIATAEATKTTRVRKTTKADTKAEPLGTLTTKERARLEVLEAKVATGLKAWVEAARALKEIRDGRLYRATHTTFALYCKDKWGINDRIAHRMIRSVKTRDSISASTAVHENAAYLVFDMLGRLPESHRVGAYKEAVSRTENGKSPSVNAVFDIVGKRLGVTYARGGKTFGVNPTSPATESRTISVSVNPARAANQIAALFDKDQLRAVVRKLTLLI